MKQKFFSSGQFAKQLSIALFLLLFGFSANAEFIEIDNSQLKKLLAESVQIIDVRRADEWAQTGVISNSKLATFFDRSGGYDARAWLARIDGLANRQKPLILICQTGARSRAIGRWLSDELGFDRVYNVSNGIDGWKRSGSATDAWQQTTNISN